MKKKALSLILAMICVFALATPALAEDTTTLTTEVPSARYTMTIPEDMTIAYGTTYKEIGQVKVVANDGFNTGKNVKVTVTHSDFACEGVSTTIPFTVTASAGFPDPTTSKKEFYYPFLYASGGSLLFVGEGTNSLYILSNTSGNAITMGRTDQFYNLFINASSSDWGKALAGTYTGTISFSAEIVAAE